jgi:hypothetical protein
MYSEVVSYGKRFNLRPPPQISPSFSAVSFRVHMQMTTSALVKYPFLSLFTVYIIQEPRNRTTEKMCEISFDIPLLIPLTRQGDEDQTLYGAKMFPEFSRPHRIFRVSLKGPDISGMGECKKSPFRNQKTFPACKKTLWASLHPLYCNFCTGS